MAGHQLVRYVVASRGSRRLIQDDLIVKVWSGIARVIGIAPLNVEYSVRRTAGYGRERSTGGTFTRYRILIYPVRTYRVGGGRFRQAGDARIDERSTESQHTIRAYCRGGEALAIQGDGERQGYGDTAVVAIHAEITRACDERACACGVGVRRSARRRCRCRRSRGGSCGRRRTLGECVNEVSARGYAIRWIFPDGITPYLRETCRILLHAYRKRTDCAFSVAGYQLVRYVKACPGWRRLVQEHLIIEVRSGISGEVGIPPLHDECSIRRSACNGSEHAASRTGRSDRVLIYPVRSD